MGRPHSNREGILLSDGMAFRPTVKTGHVPESHKAVYTQGRRWVRPDPYSNSDTSAPSGRFARARFALANLRRAGLRASRLYAGAHAGACRGKIRGAGATICGGAVLWKSELETTVSDTRLSPLKTIKAFYSNVVLISLCLLFSGCGGKPAGHRPEATNVALAKTSRLDPSLDARIDTRVGLLSNRSIEYQGGVMWTGCVLKSESANQLVWIGKPATSRLLRALRDPDKNLAAHVVLTAIWEPDKVTSARDSASRIYLVSPQGRARRPPGRRGALEAEDRGVASDGEGLPRGRSTLGTRDCKDRPRSAQSSANAVTAQSQLAWRGRARIGWIVTAGELMFSLTLDVNHGSDRIIKR